MKDNVCKCTINWNLLYKFQCVYLKEAKEFNFAKQNDIIGLNTKHFPKRSLYTSHFSTDLLRSLIYRIVSKTKKLILLCISVENKPFPEFIFRSLILSDSSVITQSIQYFCNGKKTNNQTQITTPKAQCIVYELNGYVSIMCIWKSFSELSGFLNPQQGCACEAGNSLNLLSLLL